MKKQLTTLLAVLLTCTTAIALTAWPDTHAFTYCKATFVVSPEGAGTVQPSSAEALKGTETSAIKATPNAGYTFEGWYIADELVSEDNPHKFTLNGDVTIIAKFKEAASSKIKGFIKPGCEGMGTVNVSPEGTVIEGGFQYNNGTEVTLSATASKGYQFEKWVDDKDVTVSTSATYRFEVSGDRTIYAVFSPLENYKADLVSFPSCEGYGRFTTGGRMVDSRGSKVYYVTRLDDSGEEGTFRWAVTNGDDTPRTVLFKVAGTIYLTSNVDIKSNTTVAGQTAPGGGICIAGYRVKLGSNIIIRHIRFRAGDLPKGSMSPLGMENVTNIVLDHCSLGWSMEENLTGYDNNYTTVQWCIFAEPLYNSKNVKGSRAYGAQWGGEHSTMHHCLFAHCASRSPRFNGVRTENHDRKVDSEFYNNVIFNWGSSNALYGGENYITNTGEDPEGAEPHYDRVYMVNNYYRPGPATKAATSSRRLFVRPSGANINMVGQWYLKGNKFELSSKWAPSSAIWSDSELEKVNTDNYYGFVSKNSSRAIDFWSISPSQELADKALMNELPYELSGMTPEPADDAYQKVVKQAGASLPRYDEVDSRVLEEAAGIRDPQYGASHNSAKNDGIIDSPYNITLKDHDQFAALDEATNAEIEVTCYPRLQADDDDCQVVDTDGDGLPDDYETEAGLNPADPKDGQQLTASGYSNLELFLNGVADGKIDAKKYTKHQPVATMYGFNAVVDATGAGIVIDGTPINTYTTIQDAVNAADGTTPFYIFVKEGTYEGHVQIDKANVHLTGQNKLNTIITWSKTAAEGGVDNTSTINVTADNVSFDNLTIRNTRTNEGQALALYTKGDRISITSCNLEGWQDTYRTGKKGQRHIVRNCKISGTTDFIYSDGEVYFDADTLHVLRTSNVITAPGHNGAKYGYVFNNAVITAATAGSKTHLGRPWTDSPKVTFLNTRLTAAVSIPAEGWQDMGAYPVQMAEYNTMDADGNAVDLSGRKTAFTVEGTKKECSKAVLTPVEVNGYKLDYMLRGNDNWDADWMAFILPAPAIYVTDATISWKDRTGFAQCYLVIVDGKATITTDTSRANDGKKVFVRPVSSYGILGETASSDNPTAITSPTQEQQVVSRQYFLTDGRQTSRLHHGVNIIRETLSDGTCRTVKMVVR